MVFISIWADNTSLTTSIEVRFGMKGVAAWAVSVFLIAITAAP